MNFVKSVLQDRGNGLRDSTLNCPEFTSLLNSSKAIVNLTPLVKTVLEEPITLFVSVNETGVLSSRNILKARPAILCGGEIRPYTIDEVRKNSGTEFASGKALHTFIGHYQQSNEDSSLNTLSIKEGYGAMYFADGSLFFGQWVNNQRCGLGSIYSSLGYAFEGNFKDDIPNGYGIEHFPGDRTYIGEFTDGRPHGKGVIYYRRNGSIYVGEFSRGEKHGFGIIFYENEDIFEGHWVGGRRTGEGISTSIEKRNKIKNGKISNIHHSARAQWYRDKCKWETIHMDFSYEPPSLEKYINEGIIIPFEDLESPIGYGVATLNIANELLQNIPPILLHRLERCFDRLDENFTGEIPLSVLETAFELYPNKKYILQSILKVAQESSLKDVTPIPYIDFVIFLQGLFPHFSTSDIYRHIQQEVPLEILLRLRGILAGVISGKKDGFLHIVKSGKECNTLYSNKNKTKLNENKFSLHNMYEENQKIEMNQLSLDEFDAIGGIIGGVRVPRSLFLRKKTLYGSERVSFCELLESLYPCIYPQLLRRCEVTFFSPQIFQSYTWAFSQLDELQTGSISIQSMISAKRKFISARAKGYERIDKPTKALEKYILRGRQRSRVYWEIVDISLSISFAKYIDRLNYGSITLADLLRHAYPNIPCIGTKNRLFSSSIISRRNPHNTELEIQEEDNIILEELNSSPPSSSTTSCSCCICTMCTTNGLPLGVISK